MLVQLRNGLMHRIECKSLFIMLCAYELPVEP